MKYFSDEMEINLHIKHTVNLPYEGDCLKELKKGISEAIKMAKLSRKDVLLNENNRYRSQIEASFTHLGVTVTVTPDSDEQKVYRAAVLSLQCSIFTGNPRCVGPYPKVPVSKGMIKLVEAKIRSMVLVAQEISV